MVVPDIAHHQGHIPVILHVQSNLQIAGMPARYSAFRIIIDCRIDVVPGFTLVGGVVAEPEIATQAGKTRNGVLRGQPVFHFGCVGHILTVLKIQVAPGS